MRRYNIASDTTQVQFSPSRTVALISNQNNTVSA